MDKKALAKIVESMVADVANENSLDETTARAFVGTALLQNRQALLASIMMPKMQPAAA